MEPGEWHSLPFSKLDDQGLPSSIRLAVIYIQTQVIFLLLFIRLATRGSPLLNVIGIKTTPNHAILRCFIATGTLYLLPKPLRQRYSELTVCPDTALTLPS